MEELIYTAVRYVLRTRSIERITGQLYTTPAGRNNAWIVAIDFPDGGERCWVHVSSSAESRLEARDAPPPPDGCMPAGAPMTIRVYHTAFPAEAGKPGHTRQPFILLVEECHSLETRMTDQQRAEWRASLAAVYRWLVRKKRRQHNDEPHPSAGVEQENQTTDLPPAA